MKMSTGTACLVLVLLLSGCGSTGAIRDNSQIVFQGAGKFTVCTPAPCPPSVQP